MAQPESAESRCQCDEYRQTSDREAHQEHTVFPRMGPCRKRDGCKQGQQRRPQPPFRTEHRSERQTVAEQEDSGQQVLLYGQAVQGGAQVIQSGTLRVVHGQIAFTRRCTQGHREGIEGERDWLHSNAASPQRQCDKYPPDCTSRRNLRCYGFSPAPPAMGVAQLASVPRRGTTAARRGRRSGDRRSAARSACPIRSSRR